MNVNIKKLHENASLPEYKTRLSAGADLYACLESPLVIPSGEIALVPTGISLEIPEGFEVQIRPRSGLAARGITLPNSPGTIDADYRGEIKVILLNLGKTDFQIQTHYRIAQMVLSKVEKAEFTVQAELSGTLRGDGGFGSTGI